MATCGGLVFSVLKNGLMKNIVPNAKIGRFSRNFSSSFSSKELCKVHSTGLVNVQKFSTLSSRVTGSDFLQTDPVTVKKCSTSKTSLGNQTFSVRHGTGSRGSLPHPTEVPIAVIGTNCQLDPHRNDGWANELLITLDPNMRHQLFDALREYESMVWTPGKEADLEAKKAEELAAKAAQAERLPVKELRQLALFSALPFVGFGTLDNLIMISAGEYIDTTFGAMLGISTMAAAAFGNMVSDVVGLGTAGYVEDICRKIGITPPKMSPTQYDLTSTKLTMNLGRVVGVLIGCTIGMLPLLFVKREDEDEEETRSEGDAETSTESVQGSSVTEGVAEEKEKAKEHMNAVEHEIVAGTS